MTVYTSISPILQALIALAVMIITTFLVPILKQKIGEQKWKKLQEMTEYAVRCAEQLFNSDANEMKKAYVKNYILKACDDLHLNLSDEDMDVLLEGIVNIVKHSDL